ncbi:MAG: SAM-dependent methyltransferase [Acidimicrobiales bacterium]|nr:MAG: SAM-dependent methyltransferase [Acidimicrobiales bacterium]
MGDTEDELTSGHPSAYRRETKTNRPVSMNQLGPHSATWPDRDEDLWDGLRWGPELETDRELKLLGDVKGKRVLVLGAGAGQLPVHLASIGAHVVVVDPRQAALEATREAAEEREVRVELHQSDLAELAFVRADSVDRCVSLFALATIADLARAFRQIHRVLKPGQALVFSHPHPAFALFDPASADPLRIRRSWWDQSPRSWKSQEGSGSEHPRTIEAVFTGLVRSGFSVDTILEPAPPEGELRSPWASELLRWVPATLVVRARKEGT